MSCSRPGRRARCARRLDRRVRHGRDHAAEIDVVRTEAEGRPFRSPDLIIDNGQERC